MNIKKIHKHNVIFNKTCHYFDKMIFPYLTPTSYLKENHIEFTKKQSILKIQQRIKSERHDVFTEEINKSALNNDNKITQSIDSIKHTYMKQTKIQ